MDQRDGTLEMMNFVSKVTCAKHVHALISLFSTRMNKFINGKTFGDANEAKSLLQGISIEGQMGRHVA